MSSKEDKITTNESQQRLEAIKNLIFGENIAQINSDFDRLNDLLNKRKKELEDLIDQTQNELTELIDNVSTNINIRITNLEDKLNEQIDTLEHEKVAKKTLSNLFIKLGEKIANE